MITLKQLSNANYFFAKDVMETSFPIEERPPFDCIQKRDKTIFSFNVAYDNNEPIGIFSYWHFDGFCYVEHFAVENKYRNKGLGCSIMNYFIENVNQQIILEVEKPTDEMSCRRIAFYKRLGFVENYQQYLQPSYHNDGNFVPLNIMSRVELSDRDFETIKNILYQKVYSIL